MPKPKRNIKIESPRGQISTYKRQDGTVVARLDWEPRFKPRIENGLNNAQEFVDSECLRYMNPLTPRLSGVLIKSGNLGTVIGSGSIEYLTPYARRQYYENSGSGEGQRGRLWFERMKTSKKDVIERGANRIANGG